MYTFKHTNIHHILLLYPPPLLQPQSTATHPCFYFPTKPCCFTSTLINKLYHYNYSYFITQISVQPELCCRRSLNYDRLFVQVLTPYSTYQNDTDKVCGVWRRIPREYRRLIREERLQATLLWERAELAITGQLYR